MHAQIPPAVSVVIPVHDVEPYLPALLHALDAQVLQDIEFILVNDGSRDRCGELCDEFARGRHNVSVIHHPSPVGVSQARNTGIARARGRWIGFADSDDIPEPDLWSTLLAVAEQDQLDVVLCNGRRFFDIPSDTNTLLCRKAKPAGVVDGQSWLSHTIGQDDYLVFVYLSLVRHDLIRQQHLHFLPGIVHEDILWMTQLLLAAQRVRYLDQALYNWRHRIQSITQDEGESMAIRRMRGYAVVVQTLVRDAELHAQPSARSAIRWLAAKEGINLLGLLSRLRWRNKAILCSEMEAAGVIRLVATLRTDWKVKRRLMRAWAWARLALFLPSEPVVPALNKARDSRMPIFVINLDHDTERLARLDTQMKDLGLTYTRVAGIKGDAVPSEQLIQCYDDLAARRLLKRSMTRRELGCALSHLKVMDQIAQQNLPSALVLEDDVLLSPELPALLASFEQVLAPTSSQIVVLSHAGKYRLRGAISLGVAAYAIYGHHEGYNSYGYVITQAAARNVLTYFRRIFHPLDYWSVLARSGLVEIKALVPYAVGIPSPASRSGKDDVEINASANTRKPLVEQLGGMLHRYAYRKFIYQLLVKPFLGIKKQPLGGLEARIKRNQGLRGQQRTTPP